MDHDDEAHEFYSDPANQKLGRRVTVAVRPMLQARIPAVDQDVLAPVLSCVWCGASGWPSAAWTVGIVRNVCGVVVWVQTCCPCCAADDDG